MIIYPTLYTCQVLLLKAKIILGTGILYEKVEFNNKIFMKNLKCEYKISLKSENEDKPPVNNNVN